MISVRKFMRYLKPSNGVERCECCAQPKVCACCGGAEAIRPHSMWHGQDIICRPCFIVWYDSGKTDPAQIGEESLRLKAEGKFPWAAKQPPSEPE